MGEETAFKQHTIEMVLRAEQAIAHHEGVVGNEATVMREKVFGPNGRETHVPLLTGDTIRHGLRESAARATLQAAGLLGPGLSESALRLLFSGGQMKGATKGTLKLDDYRDMCDVFPPLALLGGCAGNRIIPGQLDVGKGYLICEQSRHLLPEWVHEWMNEEEVYTNDARAHVSREQRVRMDPMLRPEARALLSAESREDVETRLLKSDNAAATDDAVEADKHKSAMMPFAYETIAAGSLFFVRIVARTTDLLQHDVLNVMIAHWLHHAVVGGKRGTGHGLLKLVQARGLTRSEVAPEDKTALAFSGSSPEIERFRAHVGERSEKLRNWLATVQA